MFPPVETVKLSLVAQVHAVFPPRTPPEFTVTAPLNVAVNIPVGLPEANVPVIDDVPVTVVPQEVAATVGEKVPAVIVKFPAIVNTIKSP
jgi:hypothetical protein